MDDNNQIASDTFYDTGHNKPDLFAPDHLRVTLLEEEVMTLSDPKVSYAALHGVVAAVLIWATNRELNVAKVREILKSTAEPLSHSKGKGRHNPHRLNLSGALDRVRRGLIEEALNSGPLRLQELVVATGLEPGVTLRIINEMVGENKLIELRTGKMKEYMKLSSSSNAK